MNTGVPTGTRRIRACRSASPARRQPADAAAPIVPGEFGAVDRQPVAAGPARRRVRLVAAQGEHAAAVVGAVAAPVQLVGHREAAGGRLRAGPPDRDGDAPDAAPVAGAARACAPDRSACSEQAVRRTCSARVAAVHPGELPVRQLGGHHAEPGAAPGRHAQHPRRAELGASRPARASDAAVRAGRAGAPSRRRPPAGGSLGLGAGFGCGSAPERRGGRQGAGGRRSAIGRPRSRRAGAPRPRRSSRTAPRARPRRRAAVPNESPSSRSHRPTSGSPKACQAARLDACTSFA